MQTAPARIRPMRAADVPAAERVCDDAFYALDLATTPPSLPAPSRRTPERSATWITRTTRLVESDPGGTWVAEDENGLLGLATSLRREDVWCLASYAVAPGRQGAGIGAALLAAALTHAEGCSRRMVSASTDPRALRRYHRAGFALHPQVHLSGEVDRDRLPRVAGVRPGTAADRPWMDDVDRHHRGGAHAGDHVSLAERGDLVVLDDRGGYAYASPGGVALLAATDVDRARTLLLACLAGAEGTFEIGHVTDANQWAVRVGLDAGLAPYQSGFLGVAGMAPPSPYLHDGALL
ncbi:GNAT family N-acetyltransferase [Nocardioides sp. GY 10113]|uniref:GNAT family N-acetyltransferase n=1 Tax=Nocardioides sp. GY 10113 TaxID=2569761 RepID=UPI0010A94290|nr:GNAT family N-acetyltransferase [Nocardioides sp. GY 10113]TIC88709.1 GNAT family N-acetyltransferase [Nocardioides sp. GY 10113]